MGQEGNDVAVVGSEEAAVRKLSGIDADMLYGETPTWHMHIGALTILDPSTMPGGFDYEGARRQVAALAADVLPLRERLLEVPFGLDRPSWVDDPGFDVDAHLHRAALPPPGGSHELAELAGALASVKLDRSRPLWEMWFIEGLEHGYVAVLTKIHHACADGVGGALLMGQMLTIEPRPAPSEMPPPSPGETIPSGVRMLAGVVPSFATLPLRVVRTLGRTATSAWRLARRPRSDSDVPAALPFRAPHTVLNHPVTSRRSVAFADLPLADVKAVSHAFDATVNDVVLALCGGALRRYLAGREELPDAPLVATVPVSVRTEETFTSFGNMVSGWFANLATDVDDPAARLLVIRDAARSAKRMYESGVEDVVMDWADLPAPALWAAAVRLYVWSHLSERFPPIFNLLVSNVPGPPMQLYAGEARVVAVYPFGPVLDSIGLNITVLSCGATIDFGIMTCPELVGDVWSLADGFHEALVELVKAAG
ncbi:MAG TPA: wax ester/triacylglycerol synthase family O-acyltransferase, partial [Acidimicrobiia bacterium]|nr:wax ester/triacylglycerol synthase family O-acyltransferase [Acidimicrobiia bacterium]